MTVDEEKLVSSPRNFAREGIETRGQGVGAGKKDVIQMADLDRTEASKDPQNN